VQDSDDSTDNTCDDSYFGETSQNQWQSMDACIIRWKMYQDCNRDQHVNGKKNCHREPEYRPIPLWSKHPCGSYEYDHRINGYIFPLVWYIEQRGRNNNTNYRAHHQGPSSPGYRIVLVGHASGVFLRIGLIHSLDGQSGHLVAGNHQTTAICYAMVISELSRKPTAKLLFR
jgi:hypothetical protein